MQHPHNPVKYPIQWRTIIVYLQCRWIFSMCVIVTDQSRHVAANPLNISFHWSGRYGRKVVAVGADSDKIASEVHMVQFPTDTPDKVLMTLRCRTV